MLLTSTWSGCRTLTVAALLALPSLAAAQQAPLDRALAALTSQSIRQGLRQQDVLDPAVTSQHTDAQTGLTYIYLRQRHQGIEVYGAVASATVTADGKLATLISNFVPGVADKARTTAPTLTAAQAVAAAARGLQLPSPKALQTDGAGTATSGLVFRDNWVSQERIPVKLMYQPMPSGELVLAWDVTLYPHHSENYWNVRVDARSGRILDQQDYVIQEPVSFASLTQQALATRQWPQVTTQAETPTANKNATPNSYNVFPITVESPGHGSRQLAVDPADATFSPLGWHDVNGVPGADSTKTRGNNVYAYSDRGNRNRAGQPFRIGPSPDGGPTLSFDFPFNTAAPNPSANIDAAVTNLFYWNNVMHDVMATKGFTEAAGNFQVHNYATVAGAPVPGGNDPVQAEAQDGGGVNNANFATPTDGLSPRMQMYEWDGPTAVTVAAPASLAGALRHLEGQNGRKLAVVGPLTGNVVAVNDGSPQPTRGCNVPFVNAAAINGNIALMRRGKCNFSSKIKNAQDAGATMVIMMDSIPNLNTLISMGGSAPDSVGIRIPSVFITKAEGDRLLEALNTGTTVTITASGERRDGTFDNGIVAHEYGHGISIRLTGGANNSSCLRNAEQMGEGWSDFFALWMTTKAGDVGTTGRGIGTYATYSPVTGQGIRTKQYSTNLAVNNLTYANLGVAPYTGVHAVGEIWCSTIWDLNWALIGRYGYNNDLKGQTGGNNLALRLVIEGLKLQGCSPGFLDGRNGILKADTLLNRGANSALIWQVFARRGMGFDAVQGSSDLLTDNTAGFALPAVLSTTKRLSEQQLEVYPNPANNQLVVRTQLSSSAPVGVELLTMLGQVVRTSTVAAHTVQQQGVTLNISDLNAGVYIVRLTTSAGTVTKKVVVQH